MSDNSRSAADLVSHLVGGAVLAPSSHNTQPWRFRVSDKRIELWADRSRALPVNDPFDRELVISCGCALLNLRVAVAHAGFAPLVESGGSCDEPDRIARVTLTVDDSALVDAELFDFIPLRRTYRHRFAAKPVAEDALRALGQAAEKEGAWLHVLSSNLQRQNAAELVSKGDAILWANPSWRRELAAWMHPRRCGDGLSLPGLAVPIAQVVVRTFDMGYGVAAKDRQLADESPVLAVLGTDSDTEDDWLRAGQALQRLLLTAVQHGLQASYLNQPVQLAELRPKLLALLGRSGFPQVLLRIGAPNTPIDAAPRRTVEEVIERA